jgi:hypothetical protein
MSSWVFLWIPILWLLATFLFQFALRRGKARVFNRFTSLHLVLAGIAFSALRSDTDAIELQRHHNQRRRTARAIGALQRSEKEDKIPLAETTCETYMYI